MDYQSEVGRFCEKLRIWREESQKELSNIIQYHSSRINWGINELVVEVNDLKVELAVITKERNHLLETVHNQGNDIKQEPLPEHEEIQPKDTQKAFRPSPEVEHNVKHKVEICTISSEIGDPDDMTSNESEDLSNVNDTKRNDIDNEENHRQVETVGRNEKEEIPPKSTPNKSLQNESKHSKNNVHDYDHDYPECENLDIHQKNLHPKLEQINNRECSQQKGNKKFKCEQCPYTSARSYNIKVHIKSLHKNIRNHLCGECGYAASKKGHLKKHIEAVHENIRNHVCGECGYAASQKIHLKKHIERVHKNIRNQI